MSSSRVQVNFQNCSRTVLELFWNCSSTVLEQFLNFFNCSWTVLELFLNSSRTVQELFKAVEVCSRLEQFLNCLNCLNRTSSTHLELYLNSSWTVQELFKNSSRLFKAVPGLNSFWTVPEQLLGGILSHKCSAFHDSPSHSSLHSSDRVNFTFEKFNRPRRKQDLLKCNAPIILKRTDHTCSNWRCTVCPHMLLAPYITSFSYNRTFPVDSTLHCMSKGIIYVLSCKLCGKQYVRETGCAMRHRFAQHRSRF